MLKNIFIILIFFCTFNLSAQEANDFRFDDKPQYPGEEIKTESGKTVRRWSTRGPVEVSPPPRPFDDPSQQRAPGGLLLNLDTSGNLNRSERVSPNSSSSRPFRMREGSIE